MSRTTSRLITIGLLVTAIILYIVGFQLSAMALLVLGGIAEIAFWIRLLRRQ